MTYKSNALEISGTTSEEAIARGLKELNLSREAVEIEILDEGTRGLFGLGSRDAVVRLTPIQQPETSEPEASNISPPAADDQSETTAPFMESEDISEDVSMEEVSIEEEQSEDELLSIAHAIVAELLQKMHVDAEISASYKPPENDHHRPSVLVEINGDDLSILIGRQAETANALQFITRLIVGKELNRAVDLEIDIQGYRARRNEQLRRLARQMADQAVRTGKRQYLEPMPSSDRRIIHIELRNHPKVYTESMGEGDRRKVTILLK